MYAMGEQAEACKQRGNECFAKGKIEAAIEAYSEAICFAPSEAVYFTNRAQCHKKKAAWDAVVADCTSALSLDDASIKAHYLLGIALDSQGQHGQAASHLLRAIDLCKGKTISYRDDIQRAMLSARKRQWGVAHPVAAAHVGVSEALVERLLRSHYERERTVIESASGSGSGSGSGGGSGSSTRLYDLQQEQQLVGSCLGEAMAALRAKRGPGRVPDYLCCKITMEPMLEPVMTPDGISYERAVIHEHLQKVGKFDPVTRRPLESSQLVPNLALKEAVHTFLEQNPWAWESPN